MKYLIILLNLFAIFPAWGATTTTDDFTFQCIGYAEVLKADDHYSDPGEPPFGRFPGIPASSGATLTLKVTELGQGCNEFLEKYNYTLDSFNVGVTSEPILSVKGLTGVPLKGENVTFEIKQHIKYVSGKNYLPLYPELYKESLSVSIHPFDKNKVVFNGGTILKDIDIYAAHKVKSIEQKSDEEKMEAVYKIVDLADWNYNSFYSELMVDLEPEADSFKEDYAKALWAFLHKVKSTGKASSFFFDFHVGSDGSYYGAPISNKILQLYSTKMALTDEELIDYIVEFPTALLPIQYPCAYISDAVLEKVVEKIHQKLPIFTHKEKSQVKELFSQNSVGFFSCGYELTTSELSKNMAEEIKEFLKGSSY